jgi:hypothetical protein
LNPCRCGPEIRTRLIEALLGRGTRGGEFLGSRQIELSAIAGGPGVGKICFCLSDFGLLAARFEVGELLFGLPQLTDCLIPRCTIGRIVLGEQTVLCGNPVAAHDRNCREQALLSGTDLDEICLRISLPEGGWHCAALPPPPSETRHDNYRATP